MTSHGVHIAGVGPLARDISPGSLVVDKHGVMHFIAMHTHGGPGGQKRHTLTMLTRAPHAHRWSRHDVAATTTVGGGHVLAAASPSGSKILTVSYSCVTNSVSTSETRITATHLVKPAEALGSDQFSCGNPSEGLLVGTAALPHSGAAILLAKDERPSETGETSNVEIATGIAGQPFSAPVALPNPSGLVLLPTGITRDPKTGELIAVAYEQGNGGVFVWTRATGQPWSDPAEVVTDTASQFFVTFGVTAFAGHVTIGLGTATGLAVVRRGPAGHWSAPQPIPGTTSSDEQVLVADRPGTHDVDIRYLRFRPKHPHNCGLYAITRTPGGWRHGSFVVRGTFQLTPEQIAYTPKRQAVSVYYAY